MLDPKELVERTESNLRQAITEGTTETEDPDVSEAYREFFKRAVDVVRQHGCKEGLLKALGMFLGNFDCADRLLQEHGFTWHGGVIEEGVREIFQEEVASCTLGCPDREGCPIPALIDALQGIEDTEAILTLAGAMWVLTQSMVGALQDYMQGGTGAVGIFSNPPEDIDVC